MSRTFAQLDSKVYQRLGGLPPEWLPLNLVHTMVVQAANIKTLETRISDSNIELSTTIAFTPTALIHNITSLIGKSIVAWVEQDLDGVYYPIEVVGLAQLTDYSNVGRLVCSVWSEAATSVGVQPIQYIQFNFVPTSPLRIRFDTETVKESLADVSSLPDDFQDLIVMKAENSCIPRIKLNASLNLLRSEDRRQDYGAILNALDGIYAQNVIEMRDLEAAWKVWAFREKGLQTPFTKATPTGRSLYGDIRGRY